MIEVRRSAERGGGSHGWLETRHSFSFGDYWDPRFMGFRSLRVLNEDWIAPGRGFPTHPHRDMEILTYVISGELAHRDSMGNGSTIVPGEIQKMSAGTGVTHSEENPSAERGTHLLQIWIEPAERGLSPSYAQARVPVAEERGRLHPLAAPRGQEAAVALEQDACVFGGILEPGQVIGYAPGAGRGVWLQVVGGSVTVGGERLRHGDGASIEGEPHLTIEAEAGEGAEILLFDLA